MEPRILVVLSARELKLFFRGPAGSEERLLRLPGVTLLDPRAIPPGWAGIFPCDAPTTLVSGWECPALPAETGQLHYVCHVGGSVRNLVPRSLIERSLMVSNWGECISETVAETALMLTLSALRRSHYYAHLMHEKKGWAEVPAGTQSLFERKVGIHGFGKIARKLIPLLRPFRVQISAFTIGVEAEEYARAGVTRSASLDALFSESEILIELEALTPATRGVVTERLLRRLPPDAVFVSLGRGQVVDEPGMIRVAAEGRIRLALEVYAQEPLPVDSPLRTMHDAVLFPHIGGPTDDCIYRCGDFALLNLARHAQGQPPEARVTLEIYDRST